MTLFQAIMTEKPFFTYRPFDPTFEHKFPETFEPGEYSIFLMHEKPKDWMVYARVIEFTLYRDYDEDWNEKRTLNYYPVLNSTTRVFGANSGLYSCISIMDAIKFINGVIVNEADNYG